MFLKYLNILMCVPIFLLIFYISNMEDTLVQENLQEKKQLVELTEVVEIEINHMNGFPAYRFNSIYDLPYTRAILSVNPRLSKNEVIAYNVAVLDASQQTGLSPELILSLINAESSFIPDAKNYRTGAYGPMQLMYLTAKYLEVDRFSIYENILGGTVYLKEMLERFGTIEKALMAYNAGPTRFDSWTNPPKASFKYVEKITRKMKKESWS